jgi:Fic family protein
LLFEIEEAPGVPFDDVGEVSNYVRALEHGMRRVKEGFPISGRLFREIHAELLAKGRGSEKAPGEYRTSQNWIGGERPGRAIFVPPPPDRVADCMSELERFLHDDPARTPTLEKAALAHVQFETIHPFLDGNGRLGRLLTTLVFVSEGVLRQPLLYLSLYLKAHRDTYYDLLQRVRTDGDWESWVGFFARGVRQTADQAVSSAQELASLFKEDRSKIQELGRSAGSALQVHYALQQHPIQTVNSVTRRSGLSVPTVTAAMRRLEEAGLVRELTGKQRNRVFAYHRYLDVLNEGTTTPGR